MAVAYTSLPSHPMSLVGRTAELETIVERLTQQHVRLLSLTGPAGVGKTHLALAARERLLGHFTDGVTFVDLAPVRSSTLVIPAIGEALGLAGPGPQPIAERLQVYLKNRETLLILDTFEHVLPAASELTELLATAAGVKLLVTSRVPLHLRWEQSLRLSPLALPDPEVVLSVHDLLEVPAVALFVERAQAQRVDFVPSERHASLLIALTHQLDGLPLAIELAAAQMQTLPLGVIVRRLDQQMRTLRWDAHDLPDRQRSLHAAIDWSYSLLSESEQRLFRHLGVFVGWVSLDAIEAVLGESNEGNVLDDMISLAEKSLIQPAQAQGEDPEPLFGILETVRQFAGEKLQVRGELEAASRAHASYLARLAERAVPELTGPEQRYWYTRLDRKHANLRVALRWCLDHGEEDLTLRLAAAVGWFWLTRGYHSEGSRWLEESLASTSTADPALRAPALLIAGLLLTDQGRLEVAKELLDEARILAEQRGDKRRIAEALTYLGGRSVVAGDLTEGRRLLEAALARWRELGEATARYQVGLALGYLAAAAFRRGDLPAAVSLLSETLDRHEANGDQHSASATRFYLATLLGELGELEAGVKLAREGLVASKAFQDRLLLTLGLEATLFLVPCPADGEQHARLLGAEDALREALGLSAGVMARNQIPNVERLREQIGPDGLDFAYREGRLLSLEQMVDLALAVLDRYAAIPPGNAATAMERSMESPLSGREQEVLRLVAEGMTSKQIGQQLFLSPRTVDHHLTSIFNKLGVDSRAQAVAVATREKLL